MEFSKGKFGRPIDGYEEMELAAIVERQERMLAESHSDGLVLKRQDRRARFLRPDGRVVEWTEVLFFQLVTVLGLIP
jgi:hypothetical protein